MDNFMTCEAKESLEYEGEILRKTPEGKYKR